jgi:hypothetical protein
MVRAYIDPEPESYYRLTTCSVCGELRHFHLFNPSDPFCEEEAEVDHFLKTYCKGRVTFDSRIQPPSLTYRLM